ncbi:phage tail protein [Photobacterium sp. GJ3]|uniref:phage tail protein n=1 Tax=Photobacterium sp. GJ3 TaxID=2829502 RepID=UPI001B8D4346|nr:tail fiber protein [Photobacterium sp. GJ3]QUJ66496.1 phage tail protein [Photobacterium sp. GJ3]
MSERYLSEITLFAGNYAPVKWAFCLGTLMPISENSALYSLLGTMFGGNGRDSYALPDLQGRVPVGMGSGPGLTPRHQGQKFGLEQVVLTSVNLPSHTHALQASTNAAVSPESSGNLVLGQANQFVDQPSDDDLVAMRQDAVSDEGRNEAHPNMAPTLALNFIICTAGQYPNRG